MPRLDLIINETTHTLSCNDGDEEKLKSLANKFNKKLKEISPSLPQADTKTLYLITALILLDEANENKTTQTSNSFSNEKELTEEISNKISSIKKFLSD